MSKLDKNIENNKVNREIQKPKIGSIPSKKPMNINLAKDTNSKFAEDKSSKFKSNNSYKNNSKPSKFKDNKKRKNSEGIVDEEDKTNTNSDKSFHSDSLIEEESDSDLYDSLKPKDKNKNKAKISKRNIGSITKLLLESKKKILPFKKEKALIEEETERNELLGKKRAKRVQRKLGYVGDLKTWDGDEKLMLKTATKGVVKLLNTVYDIRRKVDDEQKKESIVKEKKSKNFLMMHDLEVKPTVNKNFKEDS